MLHVLSATNSLTRLQIYGTDYDKIEHNFHSQSGVHFQHKLDSAASDPTFLPNLAILIELPGHISLRKLCQNRPIVFFCRCDESYMHMHADIYPGFAKGGFELGGILDLSAHDVGVLIRESYDAYPNLCCVHGITVHMCFPKEIERGVSAPIHDSLTWVATMLAASGLCYDELVALFVVFEPKLPFQSLEAQFAEIEELQNELPGLEDVVISHPEIHWSRNMGYSSESSKFFEEDTLPQWTPCPLPYYLPHCIDWWLKELKIDSPETQSDEDFAKSMAKLADGVFLRWGYNTHCNLEDFTEYLYDHYSRRLTASNRLEDA
ncbi:hypothetical protein RHS01_02328 [Rhizoctonia solani]|uniref:Uncharacterized protein n=1 Tax=Rhizoctonia solani TaxID=456999 RepID=A0A8H7IJ88_9AGAM|nr:hypothetical protein RHS01_02328 [Rhizoctonia solani]